MALYHKWDVKNDFAYVLQFFSLISDGLGGVKQLTFWSKEYKTIELMTTPSPRVTRIRITRNSTSTVFLLMYALCGIPRVMRNSTTVPLTRFSRNAEFRNSGNARYARTRCIGISGSSSCYLKQSIPYDLKDWEDQEVATMRVMLQYLSDRMYDEIRGEGLTYGISMSSSVTEGRTRVSFTRSSQLIEAYAKFREIIASYIDPSKGK